jgi:8-oxo-dGTP diphosphatase
MDNSRPLHPVSTKAILFSPDRKHVLVMQYLWENVRGNYGFPGGHLEIGEQADAAVVREVQEELGIIIENLTREDFWVHESGKVILAYSGTLDKTIPLVPSQPDGEIGVWVPVDSIMTAQ